MVSLDPDVWFYRMFSFTHVLLPGTAVFSLLHTSKDVGKKKVTLFEFPKTQAFVCMPDLILV